MAETNYTLVYGLSFLFLQTILALETPQFRTAMKKIRETYWPASKPKSQQNIYEDVYY